jgi:hypothetical protein|nr:MAG TPA_asm: Head fiber protein [Caudoviricetes sp.]
MTEKELTTLVINKIDSTETFEAMKAANQVNEDELYLVGGDGEAVTGVKGDSETSYRTGKVNITKNNIGLGNVNNTSDANKPVSTAQQTALDSKVDKVTGKGLSTNDLTATLKSNYNAAYTHSTSAHAPADAEKNIIVGVQKNGTDVNINSSTRKVNITVPTKTSDITNDSGFATETYVDTKVAGIVNSAPETLDTLNELAEALGNDPNFATTMATELGKKVDKVTGKGLSTNDYTTAEKDKLGGIEANANNYSLPVATSTALGGVKSGTDITVDTSGNVSVNDDSHNHVISNVDGLQTALDGKVSTVTGKGLSTNDYTTAEKNKLANIAANANNYSLPVATSSVLGGVKSGTDITVDSSGNVSVNDDSHNHVISNVDGLQSALDAKVSAVSGKGLSTNDYTTDEKNKLSGIAKNANNYSLPAAGSSLGGVKSGGDVSISNGTISYSSTVPVSKGGTGATTAAAACTNLGALPLSGGTLTGNLTGKYIAGTWLQTTSVSEQSAAASKIATIDGDGWIYYRTPAHIVSDLNIFQTTGGTITGAVKLTSGTNYGASLPTTIPAAGTIFFKKM